MEHIVSGVKVIFFQAIDGIQASQEFQGIVYCGFSSFVVLVY